jgi:hypothetical protein
MFDVDNYRLPESLHSETPTKIRSRRRKGSFLKGPIPTNWLSQASHLGGKTLHVGIAIWFAHGFEKEFLAAFHRGCPPSELEAVTAKLVELALARDVNAARLLLSHALPLSARVELMTEPPTEPYRVAGQRASQTNNEMAKRLMASIKRTRERDAATRK